MFSKRPKNKGGHFIFCKECGNEKVKKYQKTKNGLITILFNAQNSRIKQYYKVKQDYNREWFMKWCLSQDIFHSLYDSWVDSEYNRDLKPSIDRIDDNYSYLKNNIQIVTWKENRDKAYKDIKELRNKKLHKPIRQFELDGTFVREFFNLAEIHRSFGIKHSHISSVCKGSRKKALGFKWSYC